jgi:hypothetical protein
MDAAKWCLARMSCWKWHHKFQILNPTILDTIHVLYHTWNFWDNFFTIFEMIQKQGLKNMKH